MVVLSRETTAGQAHPQPSESALQPSFRHQDVDSTIEAVPTYSHILADKETRAPDSAYGEKAVDQITPSGLDVRDLGWHRQTHQVRPLASGINNDEVWTLVRRFNKQIFRVRRIAQKPSMGLDMNDVAGENVSSERLRAHIERLYMTVIVTLFSFYKHIVRIRSWRETPRTLAFSTAYTIAWSADSLALAMTVFLIVLITYPPARDICFPPVPAALINPDTGGVQEPLAGTLASDSITGAPERRPGEAIEQEAHSFMVSIGNVSSGINLHILALVEKPHPDYVLLVDDECQFGKAPPERRIQKHGARPSRHGLGDRASAKQSQGSRGTRRSRRNKAARI